MVAESVVDLSQVWKPKLVVLELHLQTPPNKMIRQIPEGYRSEWGYVGRFLQHLHPALEVHCWRVRIHRGVGPWAVELSGTRVFN